MPMDLVIYTCTYVELYSIQMDKAIRTCTYSVLTSMQMDKVICITYYFCYADGQSHLHLYMYLSYTLYSALFNI